MQSTHIENFLNFKADHLSVALLSKFDKTFFMARQIGKVLLSGTLDNITFYKSKYGMLARKKTSIDAKRVAKDPRFQRTRQNAAEFQKAIKAGQILRAALFPVLPAVADNEVTSRMNALFLKVLRQDVTHQRGERTVSAGQINLTEGFEFNRHASLRETMRIAYTTSLNAITGDMQATIPALMPGKDLQFPEGATHCKWVVAGAAIDFENEAIRKAQHQSGYLSLHERTHPSIHLQYQVEVKPGQLLFHTLGVLFYQQQANGAYKLLPGNAMAVIGTAIARAQPKVNRITIPVKKCRIYKKSITTADKTVLTGSNENPPAPISRRHGKHPAVIRKKGRKRDRMLARE
jgi:hypothetical protein